MQKKVEEYIMVGKENAVSQADIAMLANIPERSVRLAIDDARINRGKLIIGDDCGYYFPADIEDVRGYVKRRRASIRTSRKALEPFVKALGD